MIDTGKISGIEVIYKYGIITRRAISKQNVTNNMGNAIQSNISVKELNVTGMKFHDTYRGSNTIYGRNNTVFNGHLTIAHISVLKGQKFQIMLTKGCSSIVIYIY